MADNVPILDKNGATQTIATDNVSRNSVSEQQEIVKISLGADGVFQSLLAFGQSIMANSLPVTISSDQSAVAVSRVDHLITGKPVSIAGTPVSGSSGAGRLAGYALNNPGTAKAYVNFIDNSSPAIGSTPFFVLPLNPGQTANIMFAYNEAMAFSNPLKMVAVTALNGSTAVATAVDGSVLIY